MIEMISLTEDMIDLEYKKMFGKDNYKDREDYKFTIKIAKDFPCFKLTKAAPSWIIADIYEFVHDIFSNYEFNKAMDNNAVELNQFLDYLEELVNKGNRGIDIEICDSWKYQTLMEDELERMITFFRPKTLEKWYEYKNI